MKMGWGGVVHPCHIWVLWLTKTLMWTFIYHLSKFNFFKYISIKKFLHTHYYLLCNVPFIGYHMILDELILYHATKSKSILQNVSHVTRIQMHFISFYRYCQKLQNLIRLNFFWPFSNITFTKNYTLLFCLCIALFGICCKGCTNNIIFISLQIRLKAQ